MDEKILTHINVNGEQFQIGGGNTEAAFTLTENNGAKMSACTSTGNYAVAEGVGTTASGSCSHAEGSGTQASGSNSHAEGGGTQASGNYSHAEGGGTTASGDYSHAEGGGTTAHGYASHAEGNGTSATTQSEHASGQFNVSLSGSSSFGDSGNTLFTVGNGTYKDGSKRAHNALQIMQNGDIYIADMSGEGQYYEKPMIKLQDVINRISELETKVATLITKAEVEKGFNNVITVVNGTHLKIRNNALEDESTE